MPPPRGIPRRCGTPIFYTWMFFLCQKRILKHEIMYGIWKVKCWEGAEKNFYQDFCTLLSLCVEFRFYEVFIDWTKTNLECNSNYSCLVKTLLIGDRKDYQTPLIFLVIRRISSSISDKWTCPSFEFNFLLDRRMNHCLNSIPTEFQYKILLKKSKTMDFKQIYVQFYVQNVKSRFPY